MKRFKRIELDDDRPRKKVRRDLYKEDRGNGRSGMQNKDRYGSRDFKKPRSGGKGMFSVICDSCGEQCEVPFKPTAGKPVFCSDCFGNNNSSGSKNSRVERPFSLSRSSSRDRRDMGRNRRSDRYEKEFESINKKLDKILKALELY